MSRPELQVEDMSIDAEDLQQRSSATTNESPDEQPRGFAADMALRDINMALEYIDDSRSDIEQHGTQPWIDDVVRYLQGAIATIKKYEIDTADDAHPWTDDDGVTHDVVLRQVNPEGFDEAMMVLRKSMEKTEDYVHKHVDALKKSMK